MPKTVKGEGNKINKPFGWLPELDRLLIADIKHGPAQKAEAPALLRPTERSAGHKRGTALITAANFALDCS
jgi:hypothetical protein